MQRIEYLSVAERAMIQIREGAFLTVREGDDLNTMTIGWAMIGFVWCKPMVMVAVRDSRYTFRIMERAGDFTVSVPTEDFSKELDYCGSRSGRDGDKFAACGLRILPAQKVDSPIIDLPGLHFECRIVLKSPMDPANLIEEYSSLYQKKDFHTLYFGELVACYSTENTGGDTRSVD